MKSPPRAAWRGGTARRAWTASTPPSLDYLHTAAASHQVVQHARQVHAADAAFLERNGVMPPPARHIQKVAGFQHTIDRRIVACSSPRLQSCGAEGPEDLPPFPPDELAAKNRSQIVSNKALFRLRTPGRLSSVGWPMNRATSAHSSRNLAEWFSTRFRTSVAPRHFQWCSGRFKTA